MFLVTIMPWHVMKSRWGLESYLLSPMLLFSIYSLLKAVKGKKLWQCFVSGLIFGLTLYTYALSYIVIPLFLVLTLIYLIIKKKVNIKQVIVFSIPLFLLALPLILMLMVQEGIIDEIDGFITIPKMRQNRIGEVDITKFKDNIKSLKYVFIEPLIGYNAIKGFGPLYPIGVVLMCLGILITIVKMIKEKVLVIKHKMQKSNEIDLSVIMLFVFISNFFLSFLTTLNINKANGIYISATYFIFVTLMTFAKKTKIIFMTLVITLVASFVLFIKEYFTTFANSDQFLFENESIEVLEQVYNNKNLKNKKISAEVSYIYSLYANPISPYEFNEGFNYTQFIDLENIRYDTVYITRTEDTANTIERFGFKKKQYKRYYILYK